MKMSWMAAGVFCAAYAMAAFATACAPTPAEQPVRSSPSREETTSASISSGIIIPTRTKYPTRTRPYTPTITPTITPLELTSILLPGWVPEGARARLGRGIINKIVLSPDGKTLAVAGATGLSTFRRDNFEEIWSVPTNQSVDSVSFSTDGKTLATTSIEISEFGYPNNLVEITEVLLWDALDGKGKGRVSIELTGLNDLTLAFSPNGKYFAATKTYGGEAPYEILVWDFEKGEKIFSLVDTEYFGAESMAFSSDGRRLVVGSRSGNGMVFFWDVEAGHLIAKWKYEDAGPKTLERARMSYGLDHVALSPDGKTAAVSFGDQIELWDVTTQSIIFEWQARSRFITLLVFSPDGRSLSAGDSEGNLVSWNTETGAGLYAQQALGSRIRDMIFSEDGRETFTALADGIRVGDADSGEPLRMLTGLYSNWKAAAVHPLRGEMAAQTDGKIAVWKLNSLEPIRSLGIPKNVSLTPDLSAYAFVSDDGKIRIVDVLTGRMLSSWSAPVYESPDRMGKLIFSPDGRILAIEKINHQTGSSIELINTDNGLRIPGFLFPSMGTFNTLYATFSTGGGFIAIGAWDWEYGPATVVYPVDGGGKVSEFEPSGSYRFAMSDAGSYAVTTCMQTRGLCLYDLPGGGFLRFLETSDALDTGPRKRDVPISFSPDARFIAAGMENGAVCLWNSADGRLLQAIQGHSGWVAALSISLDGNTLVSVGGDGSVVVWEVNY